MAEAPLTKAAENIPGRPDTTAFVGQLLQQFKKGLGGVAIVAGEPGFGKSHTLEFIEHHAKALNAGAVVRVDCTPPIGKVNIAGIQPLQPFGKAIERLYQEGEQAAKKRLAMNIGMSLLASLPIAGDIFYAMKAIRQDVSEYQRETAAMQHKKRAAVTECIETLEQLAKQSPFVVLVDDAHWSDPQSVEVVRQLRRRITDIPLLLVLTVTPTITQRVNLPLATLLREPLSQSITTTLQPIEEQYTAAIVQSVDASIRASDTQLQTLHSRSAGTPGIIVEYVRYLKQTSQISADGTIASEALEHSGVKLSEHPATDIALHDVGEDDALILALCAAEGQEFTAFMVAALMNTDVVSAVRQLRQLQHSTSLIKSVGMRTRYGVKSTTYEFTSSVAYTYFLHYPEYEERKHIHQRIAEILTREHDAATLEEVRAQLAAYIAVHSAESEDEELANRMFAEAAQAAESFGSPETAAIIRNEFLTSVTLSETRDGEALTSGEGGSGGDATSGNVGANVGVSIRAAADAIVAGNTQHAIDICAQALDGVSSTVTERVTLLCLYARALIEAEKFADAEARVNEAAAYSDIGIRDTCMIINTRATIALRQSNVEEARALLHEASQYAGQLSGALRLLTLGNIMLLQRYAGEPVNDRYQRTVDRALEQRSWSGFKEDLRGAY